VQQWDGWGRPPVRIVAVVTLDEHDRSFGAVHVASRHLV
jgi:hypothetical protein